jgi:hypothetical protein
VSQVQFLLDEQIPAALGVALLATEPAIVFRQVGAHPDVPPKGTLDPDVLLFAEREQYALVTFDKRSMPGHVTAHLTAGNHTCGVFWFPNGYTLSAGRVVDELVLIWATSQRDEWMDRFQPLPFPSRT